eukprot:6196835-Pleurochrysis_carterae.AAC.1
MALTFKQFRRLRSICASSSRQLSSCTEDKKRMHIAIAPARALSVQMLTGKGRDRRQRRSEILHPSLSCAYDAPAHVQKICLNNNSVCCMQHQRQQAIAYVNARRGSCMRRQAAQAGVSLAHT